MRKSHIFIASLSISVVVFFAFFMVFKGTKSYIVNQFKSNYVSSSPRDSLYMRLLNNPNKREQAMAVSKSVEKFYFITDSVKTIMDAKIAPELIAEIIIGKGLANEMKQQLWCIDTTTIVNCKPNCLTKNEMDDTVWLAYFENKDVLAMKDFVQQKIKVVMESEKQALMHILNESLN